MKRRVFRSDEDESKFSRRGYLLFDFLSQQEVEQIKEKVKNLQPEDNFEGLQGTLIQPQSFHCTFFDANQEYKNEVFKLISSVYRNVLTDKLDNYKVVQANIFLKPPHTGEVSTHQNLTIVDETKYRSISLWCPLVDVKENNGTLMLVPGSQGKFAKYRNTTIVWPLLDLFRKEEGSKYLLPIDVKAGQLLILDDSIIHASPPNHTDEARAVLHILAAPKEASPIYCDLEDGYVKVYEVEEDFWQTHIPGNKPPQGSKLIKSEIYNDTMLNLDEFLDELKSPREE